MEILYGKKKIQDNMIKQINDLFVMNYKKYHYINLTNFEGIQNLIAQKAFDCICICENKKVVGFAAFYEYNYKGYPVSSYKLAHLLVDCNCRGKGLGSILEDGRLSMINKRSKNKVVYASCVEQPKNSMFMKLDRGFRISGFKYHYRNVNNKRENALILVNIASVYDKCKISVNTNSDLTRRIIQESNPDTIFSNDIHSNIINFTNNVKYSIDIVNDKYLGRIVGRIYTNRKSTEDLLTLSFPDERTNNYMSIVVNPAIEGFAKIDRYLQSKNYYPISYIPYINDNSGELEYQYLPYGIEYILNDSNVSSEGKKFIQKVIGNI